MVLTRAYATRDGGQRCGGFLAGQLGEAVGDDRAERARGGGCAPQLVAYSSRLGEVGVPEEPSHRTRATPARSGWPSSRSCRLSR